MPPQTKPQPPAQPNKRARADKETFVLMLVVAIFFDVIQGALTFIPIAGWLLSLLTGIFAWLTFFVWMKIKGWEVSGVMKEATTKWVLPLVEVVPILNALPAWTLKVALTYSFIKAEDVIHNATGGKADVGTVTKVTSGLKKAA